MSKQKISAALFVAIASSLLVSAADADVLKGRVTESGEAEKGKPGLSRSDLQQQAQDQFKNMAPEILEAPKEAFKAAPTLKPAKPPKKVKLKGDADFTPMFQGAPQDGLNAPQASPMDGLPDAMQPPQQQQQMMPPQPAFDPNDPDMSPDMQLAWDMWHKRVAATIYDRFNFFAKSAFRMSPPLMAQVGYVVRRDGRIVNLQVTHGSKNPLFNVLVTQAVKSLEGDMTVLAFPNGSRRVFVQKAGTFTQNYGGAIGFRHLVGDVETVH